MRQLDHVQKSPNRFPDSILSIAIVKGPNSELLLRWREDFFNLNDPQTAVSPANKTNRSEGLHTFISSCPHFLNIHFLFIFEIYSETSLWKYLCFNTVKTLEKQQQNTKNSLDFHCVQSQY